MKKEGGGTLKQFFRFKRLWVSPLSIEIAFSSFWKSRCRTIICLSVFKRDQNSTGFEQYRAQFMIGILSIDRNCEREFKPIIFVVVPYFDRSTFFPELPTNSFWSGAPRWGAHYWSGFATYCRVQYLFFTHMSHGNLKSRAIKNRPSGTWNFNLS